MKCGCEAYLDRDSEFVAEATLDSTACLLPELVEALEEWKGYRCGCPECERNNRKIDALIEKAKGKS